MVNQGNDSSTMLYIANKQFLHKFCINRKKRTLKPSFLRDLATRRIIRAPSIALLTKVLELRSYLGFRAFLFCYTVLAKVFEKIINAYLSKKLLIILKRMIIIYFSYVLIKTTFRL